MQPQGRFASPTGQRRQCATPGRNRPGLDDDTWLQHLRKGDYSRWIRESIKDQTLANKVQEVEEREDISPLESRYCVREAVEEQYTLPT